MSLRNSNSGEGDGFEMEQAAFIEKKTEPKQKWKRTVVGFIDRMEIFVQNLPKKMRLFLYHFKHAPHLLYGVLCLFILVSYLQSEPAKDMTSSYESYGLINVPDQEWYRLKTAYADTIQHVYDKYMFIDDPNVWYQYNFPVEFTCPNPQRIGKSQDKFSDYDGYLGDGKWICNPKSIVDVVHKRVRRTMWQRTRELLGHHYREKNSCLIYSIGVNAKHIGFETGIQTVLTREANKVRPHRKKDKPFCEIHVFDPAGYNEQLVLGDGIAYHNWGIISSSRTSIADVLRGDNSDGGFKSFQQTIRELGHEGHVIDIMKVDCKMCEWGIYDDWFEHDNDDEGIDMNEGGGKEKLETRLSMVQQILVETHGTPEEYVNEFFERMQDENYAIFHKDSDTQNFQGTSQDYAFVKLTDEFFELR